jgi:MFS transporter, SP family, general alpha glucoside:H+ symporter
MAELKNNEGIVASEDRMPTAVEEQYADLNKSHNEIFISAKSATDKEQKMSLWQGIKLYPKAVGWSMLISTCICMEGYDLCLLGNFYGE